MKNILSKLWISITAMAVILLIVVWWFNIFLLDRFYIQQKIDNLYEKGEALAQVFESSDLEMAKVLQMQSQVGKSKVPREPKPDQSDQYPKPPMDASGNFEHREDFFYYLDTEDIDQLYSQSILWPEQPAFVSENIAEITSGIKTNERFSQKLSSGDHKDFHSIIVGVPLKKDGSTQGYLLFFSMSKNISQTTAILKRQFSMIAIISIAISSAFAFMLAKYFAKPILLIKSASDTISKGHYGVQVSVKNNDEIGLLAKSINSMSKELVKIEEFRRDFIANITHEFKTPLSVIKSYAEMIKDIDIDDNESISYDANVILGETERLSSMVSEVLYLSKMQSNNSALEAEQIDVCSLIDDATERTVNMASLSGVNLVKSCTGHPLISADREKITRCLVNFISNSIGHTPPGKSVYISSQPMGADIMISVADEGCGISSKDLPHIWDRFYKADKARRSGPQGTGLGMAIAKDILQMHGFEYGISSIEGEGTTVYFTAKVKQ